MPIESAEFESPIGNIRIVVRDGVLCALGFTDRWRFKKRSVEERFGAAELRQTDDPGGVIGCLRRYFAGDMTALDPIQVDTGGTPFQRAVWAALRRIPAGRTASYSELARAINAPAAVRAVGAANGANPIGIVIPCHRVIGADGRLVGYGGGLERKRWLLAHEGGLRDLPLTFVDQEK
jgi:O-6-methylguanine DNA methyltransferase